MVDPVELLKCAMTVYTQYYNVTVDGMCVLGLALVLNHVIARLR